MQKNNGRRKRQRTSTTNKIAPANFPADTSKAMNGSVLEQNFSSISKTSPEGPPPGISDAKDSSDVDSDCTLAWFMQKKLKKLPRRRGSKHRN